MNEKIIRVKLSTNTPTWSFIRQTPLSQGLWGNCQFYIDDDTQDCDWWVIFDGLQKEQTSNCYPENTILITGEPPSIKKYENKFIKQFNTIITVQKNIKSTNIINLQLLPWYVGGHYKSKDKFNIYTKGYDELKRNSNITKNKLISVISSKKITTKGHRQRYKFVQLLKAHFGDKIDIFGSGINKLTDKWNGIAPYKYHIVIENSIHDNYWTEKLADSFLGESYPFYYGCPNIDEYFSQKALTKIDINKPEDAIKIIEKSIKENYYEQFKNNILESKNLILDKYQIFPQLCRVINDSKNSKKEKVLITIMPEIIKKKNILLRITYKLLKIIQ